MTAIPLLAFGLAATGIDDTRNLDKAVYFAMASWFPSPAIPAILAKAAIPYQAAIPSYPARPATAAISANPNNPARLAGELFLNSPAFAAGAAIPAFPAKAATAGKPAVPGQDAVVGVAAVPAKTGIPAIVLDRSNYESTTTHSKFTLFLPINLMIEAMYGDINKSISAYDKGTGDVNYRLADGITLPSIAGVKNLEQLIYHYAKSDSDCTISREILGGNIYLKIVKDADFPTVTDLRQASDQAFIDWVATLDSSSSYHTFVQIFTGLTEYGSDRFITQASALANIVNKPLATGVQLEEFLLSSGGESFVTWTYNYST